MLADPIAGVAADDRAERGSDDHEPDVERGIGGGVDSRHDENSPPGRGIPMLSRPTMNAIAQ